MRLSKKDGFTIVELLIVVVVIAILAAITIVAYNGISNRAKLSALTSTASQASKKVLLYATTNSEAYPNTLADVGIVNAGGKTYQYSVNSSTNPQGFCLSVADGSTSVYTATNFTYTGSSTQTLNQSSPVVGSCPGHSGGGQTLITNAAINPRGLSTNGSEWGTRYGTNRTWVTGVSDGPTADLNSYVRFTQVSTQSGSGRGIDLRTNLDTNPSATQAWPVTAGEPLTLSLYTRSSVSNTKLQIIYRVHDGTGTWLGSGGVFCPAVNYTANTWVRITCDINPPATGYLGATARYQDSASWPSGSTIDATGLMLSNGSTVPAFADGNSPGWVWTGAANSSASTGPAL